MTLAGCGGGGGRDDASAVGSARESEGVVNETEESASAPSGGARQPHPAFALTHAELMLLVAGEAEATRAAVAARPELFLDLVGRLLLAPDALTVLVDKQNALAHDYVPPDLIPLSTYAGRLVLNRNDLSLRALIMPSLVAMVEAARLEGITLDLSSTYRSYAYQQGLFERWVRELGEAEAERVSARAGTSQHQLGTTVDFGSITLAFADTAAGRWLAANASRYGFSLSYPDGFEAVTGYSYEPWHFRYIGRDGTRLEAEFFGGVQQYMLEFLHERGPELRERLQSEVAAATLGA